jgi:hypothetical protein
MPFPFERLRPGQVVEIARPSRLRSIKTSALPEAFVPDAVDRAAAVMPRPTAGPSPSA